MYMFRLLFSGVVSFRAKLIIEFDSWDLLKVAACKTTEFIAWYFEHQIYSKAMAMPNSRDKQNRARLMSNANQFSCLLEW